MEIKIGDLMKAIEFGFKIGISFAAEERETLPEMVEGEELADPKKAAKFAKGITDYVARRNGHQVLFTAAASFIEFLTEGSNLDSLISKLGIYPPKKDNDN